MRRLMAPVVVAGRPYRAVTVAILVGLLAAACGPIDYAETLRYEGQDYRTKCYGVREGLLGGPIDIETTILAIDAARTIRTVPTETAIAVRMNQLCKDVVAGTWLLAPARDLTAQAVSSLAKALGPVDVLED
jgi:hypothetical protein